MTTLSHTDRAIAELTAAQDVFDGISAELKFARVAMKRSKNKANIARYAAASEAFDKAFDEITALHEAVGAAEDLDVKVAAAAEQAAFAFLQPDLL